MAARTLPECATVVAAGDLLATEFGHEVVMLNLQDGVYYGLDHVGARIWRLLQEPVSIDTLREAIVSEYRVEPARCERDLRALIDELAAKGLVEIKEGA